MDGEVEEVAALKRVIRWPNLAVPDSPNCVRKSPKEPR